MPRRPLAIATCLLSSHFAYAAHEPIEEVLVEGTTNKPLSVSVITEFKTAPLDTAALLKTLPGANVNSNGPVTGIVQYRGLYGNRVDVQIDHNPVLTGGPNTMDSPLSYTPPLLLKKLEMQRGIASVSAGQETLGGHVNAVLDRGEFTRSENAELSGSISSRYNGNTDGGSHAVKAGIANSRNKLTLLSSHDEGNDTRIGGSDTLAGTEYRRSRYDLSYGWQNDRSQFQAFVGKLDTRNTGTPALPMDIIFIESDLAGFGGSMRIGDTTVSGNFSYSHIDHGMDNFSQRLAPASMMRYRFNHATARGISWDLKAQQPLASGTLTIGADGSHAIHNSEISNPNNSMFAVHNFNDIERDVIGLFAEWQSQLDHWEVEAGLRYNRVEMDADPVGVSGLMGMIGANATLLANRFNTADRSQNDDNVDIVLKAATDLTSRLNLELGLASKNRAPSYQERYLWLPLQSTGGLADGRSYTGNLALDSETSNEITVGLNWTGEKGWVSPQIFYRQIEDYIQGVPSTDATANMLSTMMSGEPALMFANVDAKMAGVDVAYGYHLSVKLRLEGNLSYVQGENTDNNDDLYRIAPLNNRLALIYERQNVKLTGESVLYAKQSKVAEFNDEEKTSGYGIFNIHTQITLAENIEINAGVQNLFNKRYQDHLAGYNRNGNSDIAVGERLIGAGRNAFIGVTLNW